MELDRAREITRSVGVIEVTYYDKDVWLEELFEESLTARIKDLETDQQYLVPLSRLQEK